MGKFIQMAWRNLWRNWRRTSIALVAIALGVVLLILMDSLLRGSDQAIFGNAVRLYGGNIQIHAPGYREKSSRLPLLPLNDNVAVLKEVRAQSQIISASQRINTLGLVSSHGESYPVAITAIEPAVEAPRSIQAEHMLQGRFLLDEDMDAVLIGKGLADLLNLTVGDNLNLVGRKRQGEMHQRTMTIVGIYDLGLAEAEKRMVYIPLAEAQTLYNLRNQITEISLTLQSVGQEDTIINALKISLPNYEIDSWQTLKPELKQTIETKKAYTGILGIVVVLIASIGILNLLLMAVFERTREMGVLAALGLKGWQIMGLFLLEGTLIGIVGAIAGCIIGSLLAWLISQVGIDLSYASGMGELTALLGSRLYPSIAIVDVISRGITVSIIAALASLYPAWQASGKQPAEVLHHI
ncbi:MAG: FtsX-like permease family protein [Chloroflexota bacterium]